MCDSTSLIRPPGHFMHPETIPLDDSRTVGFFHPGYSCSEDHDPVLEILRLPAYDHGGIHHGTALAAMTIIANNQKGYFTADAPTGTRVNDAWDSVLPGDKNYYFNLDNQSAEPQYEICSSFTDWTLLPSAIPLAWRNAFDIHSSYTPLVTRSHMSSGVHQRDVSCRVTASIDATENAHIIPRSEALWFISNGMNIYNFALRDRSPEAIDDVNNGILLRSDLQYMFDQKVFCPVVKAGKIVSHYLKRTNEMGNLYHNAELRITGPSRPVEFLWTRFAWSILPRVGNLKDRLRLLGRIPVEDKNDVDIAATTKLIPATRKHDEVTPRRSKRIRAGRGRGKEGTNDTSDYSSERIKKSSATLPQDISQRELSMETERDSALKAHYFPEMKEDKLWSEDATWQFAPWYPGMEHTERVKRWWRMTNPQIAGGADGSGGFTGSGTIARSKE